LELTLLKNLSGFADERGEAKNSIAQAQTAIGIFDNFNSFFQKFKVERLLTAVQPCLQGTDAASVSCRIQLISSLIHQGYLEEAQKQVNRMPAGVGSPI